MNHTIHSPVSSIHILIQTWGKHGMIEGGIKQGILISVIGCSPTAEISFHVPEAFLERLNF